MDLEETMESQLIESAYDVLAVCTESLHTIRVIPVPKDCFAYCSCDVPVYV